MKRLIGIVVLIAAVVAIVLLSSRKGDQPYRVRAIFDNAGFVIPGEDVKIAGVKVGKIESLEITRDFKAAVVLEITEAGYQDFRRDASCIVRPQNLIGERFVECKPTQARSANSKPPADRLVGLQTDMLKRCPGSASQIPPDNSAPFRDTTGNLDCDPSQVPPGP